MNTASLNYQCRFMDKFQQAQNISHDAELQELRDKLKYSDTLCALLERLANTFDIKAAMDAILAAFMELTPFYTISYVIAKEEGAEFSNLLYVSSQGGVSRSYLSRINRDLLSFARSLPDEMENKNTIVQQLGQKMFYQFIQGKLDDEKPTLPVTNFIVPLKTRSSRSSSSRILGLFDIAFSYNNSPSYESIASDIAKAASAHIEKLHWLARAERTKLNDLISGLTNGVLMFDKYKKVIISNPVLSRMIGLSESHLELNEFIRLFEGSCKEAINLDAKIDSVLRDEKAIHIEEIPISRFYYELFISPIKNPEGNVVGGAIILHDITHYKEINRMKTEFVSLASHQLRTPLTPLRLFSEMLLNGEVGKLNNGQREYVDSIYQSTKRMIGLVNDLLNVSRLETGRLKIEPELTQLEDFVEDIIKEAQGVAAAAAAADCKITFKRPTKKLSKIPIDQRLLRQVIQNLIVNAIQYSPNNQCDVTVKLEKGNDAYLISVRDNGIGIPKDIQVKVFDKFFRADNAQKLQSEGSGIGLYIAKMIMKAVGGKIWFESPPKGEQNGTIFYVSIPAKGMAEKKGEKGLNDHE